MSGLSDGGCVGSRCLVLPPHVLECLSKLIVRAGGRAKRCGWLRGDDGMQVFERGLVLRESIEL